MCHLEKLEMLVLARNALSEMPRLLAAFLRRLRVVDLSCNKFKRIPPVLASLTCLHTVNLSGNQDLEVCFWVHPLRCARSLKTYLSTCSRLCESL
jgi:Leucine-rich repeat (LRR) protein